MNKILLFLALSMGLQANFAQSMEQATQKPSLFSRVTNSRYFQVGVFIAGSVATRVAADLVWDWYTRPEAPARPLYLTFAEMKEKIKQDTRQEILEYASRLERGLPQQIASHTAIDPICGYHMAIAHVDDGTVRRLRATYTYNCDNSQEVVEISVRI